MQGVGLGLAAGLRLRPAEDAGMLTLPRQTKAVRRCWDESSHWGEVLLALNGSLAPFKAQGNQPYYPTSPRARKETLSKCKSQKGYIQGHPLT